MKQCSKCSSFSGQLQICYLFLIFLVFMVHSIQTTELNYRLPNNTFPLRYNIELTTNIHNDTIGDDRFRFDGKVTIQLMAIGQPIASNITLNFRQINIKHVKLWHIQNGWEQILIDDDISFTLDPVREFVTVHSPQPLNGSYYLELQYNGTLREDNAGFYRSSYRTSDGSMRWLATTQFSSTDARHAFPCYDEPGIRAPIGLRVIHGKQYMALSNSIPIDMRESLLDGMVITTFADTPRMQSYLLGIVVSDFSEVSLPMYSRQKAFVRSNAISGGQADFIVEAGFKILAVLEEFLQTPYILPKLYHVAVPDFAPGAMENYGLITYKEENFFYDRVNSPMKQLKTIATIVGHEVGHHFFGNYVSPAWWSFLWMKEGFARFFEYLAPQLVYPELDIDETYAVEKTQNVFEMDSSGNVRPMTFYVNTQNEIAGIFDDIAYDKGGAVLRMFHHALGQDTFRRALVLYLHNNSLDAATPEQFAEAIQKAINEVSLPTSYEIDAIKLLKSWTEQAGYPLLFVSRTSNCSIKIHQEKYLLRANSSKLSESWILPFNFATAKQPIFENTTPNGWLTTADEVIYPTIENNWTCQDWIVFNKQQTGYYRVNYDNDLWQLIIDALMTNHAVIHRVNRAQLIDDALNNARTGRLDYEMALRLLQYLNNEYDYAPWASVNRNLKFLNVHLEKSASYHLWQRYCLDFIEPVYDRMGLATHPQDSLQRRMAREIVVMWACKLGSLHCRNSTADILQHIVHNTSLDTDPDLREQIYCNGLRYGTSDTFYTFFKRMQNSQDQGYRSELIRSLGCVQDESLLEQFLSTTIAIDGFNYYGQERDRVLEAVYSSGYMGMRVAINFFKSHMAQINELYNKGNFGGRAISTAIQRMAKQTASEDIYIELRELMEQLLEIGFLQNSDMLRALEQSNENLEWINTKGQLIEFWLHTKYETTSLQTTTSTVSSSIYTSQAEISNAETTTRSSISYSVDPTTQTSTSIGSFTSLRTSVHSSLFPVEGSTLSMPISLSTENYHDNSHAVVPRGCILSKMLAISLIVSIIFNMSF